MQYGISILLSGISLGGQYALIAIGYTMVYGILRLINFAHGDVFMVSGLIAIYLTTMGLPLPVTLALAILITVLLGFLIERVAYKPLRSAPRMSVMISAIGVSYLLQNTATFVTGGQPMNYPTIPALSKMVTIGGASTTLVTVVTPILVIGLVFGLVQLINHTKIGMAMRAVAKDFETSQLMGIKINRVISTTFIIGSALAAIAGVLLCSFNTSLMPTTGSMPGIKAFTAAVFGGIGSIPGAFLGGLLLGIIEAMAKAYISTNLANSIVFAVLIVVLLVKPSGLLGKYVPEKV